MIEPIHSVVAPTPQGPIGDSDNISLDDLVAGFEEAFSERAARLDEFLPSRQHSQFADIVTELIRVELELSWKTTERSSIELYRSRFPDVLSDTRRFAEVAFEEYRLRRASGEGCTREEYRDRFGIVTSDWPELALEQTESSGEEASGRPFPARGISPSEDATHDLPDVGDRFLDFELINELGRGAFGRVYLASQSDLADRLVALKISAHQTEEPQRLAQLQHTNIVPIYSWHRQGPLQAICMPFLGCNTLADVLRTFQVSRSIPISGQALVSTMVERQAGTVVGDDSPPEVEGTRVQDALPTDSLRRLEKMSYREAAAWITARLAAGLAHAHEHGITHRDLKPANILLSDDGEPMILDFNLSAQRSHGEPSVALVGGTLPYMSPEHLEAMCSGGAVGPQADLYSLGVILFEMLAGELPYPLRRGTVDQITRQMIKDRGQPARSVRTLNTKVTPDLEAIVAKCLEIEPEARYQSARDLQQDLELHLDDLPLAHARGSFVERAQKWCRRHPRVTSTATVGALLSLVCIALLAAFIARGRTIARDEVNRKIDGLLRTVAVSRTELNVPGLDKAALEEAVSTAEDAAARLDLFDADPLSRPVFQLVEPERQAEFRRGSAELLYLLASGKALLGLRANDELARAELFAQALTTNSRAVAFLDGQPPGAILLQRARILAADGQSVEAEKAKQFAQVSNTVFDRYLNAAEAIQRRDYTQAASLLESLLHERPQDYSSWFGLGSAYIGQQQFAKAEGCFTTCIALNPALHQGYFMRGYSRLQVSQYAEARRDFDHVLRLRESDCSALVNRALASRGLGQLQTAIADITKAIDIGTSETRVYFIRAGLRRAAGDQPGAQSDLERGLQLIPSDELSWIARGIAQLNREPELALSDFARALELNPASSIALLNSAHVLSEHLKENEQALEMMDRLIELSPQDPLARANRGVLLARLGRCEGALLDARAVSKSASADVRYRVACIYALLVDEKGDAELRTDSIEALRDALFLQPTLIEKVVRDVDLIALHRDPDFRRLVAAAQVLQPKDPNKAVK